MAWALDDLSVGWQMQIGTGKVPAIGIGKAKINGSGHVEGPMVVGNPTAYGGVDACLMVAPLTNSDPDCSKPKKSIGTSGSQDVGLKVTGNVIITGRKSKNSLYNENLVTFEESNINYNPKDSEGFIKLNALRLMSNKS